MKEKLDLIRPYIDAYQRASDRTRSVYLTAIAFSIVSIASFINSAEWSWHRTRLTKASLGYALLYAESHSPSKTQMSLEDQRQARKYITDANIRSLDEAKMILDNARKQVSASQIVQVPLFGLSFHGNDLGLVAGVALTLLTLLMKQSLIRELSNLILVSTKSRDLSFDRETYELLSTSEVLHRPEPLDSTSALANPKLDVPLLLGFVPVISYFFVFSYDLRTIDVGFSYSVSYSTVIVVCEAIFGCALIYLTWSCFNLVQCARTEWRGLYERALVHVDTSNSAPGASDAEREQE